MIKNYINMKKNEWKVKALFYSAIINLINNQKEVLEMFQKMYIALKDVPVEELQKELIGKLAEIVHEKNKDNND